jgi:SAM-dependent methyltransferase
LIREKDENIHTYGKLYDGLTKSEWKVCGECGFVHQNPRPTTEALNQYYLDSAYHGQAEDLDLAYMRKLYKGSYDEDITFLTRAIGLNSGKVFDMGCGLGFALDEFRSRGWEPYGVEPDLHRSQFAREKLGLTRVSKGILDGAVDVGTQVDLVFSHHALEHVADFEGIFAGVKKILRPGGFFFASIPTYYRNRSAMSLRYLNSGHYSSFTHHSLNQLLARNGFEPVAHRYYNRPGMCVTDDLMLVGRYVGKPQDPKPHYEDPQSVQRYVNMINPVRSAVFAPVYSVHYRDLGLWFRKVGVAKAVHYLLSPRELAAKVSQKIKQAG